jgi:hypothetical protein
MMQEVSGPDIINPLSTCYINALVQILFHTLPLRLIVITWPNHDPTISKLRVLFTAMSQHQLTDAVSLSTLSEVDVLDAKDCL